MMWTDLPLSKRAPKFVFLFVGLNTLFIVISVAKGQKMASVGFTFALTCTTLLYVAAVRAARKERPYQLKRYMNVTVIIYTAATFLFLAGK